MTRAANRDDDTPIRRHARKRPRLTPYLVAAGVLTLAAMLAACGVGFAIMRGGGAGVTGRDLPTRDEFEARYVGKTEREVLAAIGRPARTTDVGGATLWVYERVTYDPLSGKVDGTTALRFENGRVAAVRFF